MKRLISSLSVVLVMGGLLVANGLVLSDLQDISQTWPMPEASHPPVASDPGPLVRIGVISRFAPNITYAGYQPILDYLNSNGSFHYELRLSTSYQDAMDRLASGEVAASFLGAWMTSHLDPEGDLVPLLAPLNAEGDSGFHVVLVTRPESGLTGLADLADKQIALPSEQSWSGNWLRVSGLPPVDLEPSDLSGIHHFEHHQTVVWQVLRGTYDAGVVKESVARKYESEGLVLLERSAPFPGPPLVGNLSTSPLAIEEITRLLLAVDPGSPTGQAILGSWTSEFSRGFRPIDLEAYRQAFGPIQVAP